MSGLDAKDIRLNPKLFLVDVKSFADSAQLSSAIGKGSIPTANGVSPRILAILF